VKETYVALFVLLVSSQALLGQSQARADSVSVGERITVAYREPADRFEILDHVSAWWPEYVEPEYRASWAARGLSRPGDSAQFASYKAIRDRYFNRSGQGQNTPGREGSGLFTAASVLTADPLASIFHRAVTMNDAFVALASILRRDEVATLRKFYAHFESRLAPLVAETRELTARSREVTASTLRDTRVSQYLLSAAALFASSSSPGDRPLEALYVWWPDTLQRRASPAGTVLVLRVRPSADETVNSSDVVAHEAMHVFAARMPETLQKSISGALLDGCSPPKDIRRLVLLEEPLATALGNITFRQRFQPQRFSWGRRWYGNAWVDVMSRLLQPMLAERMAAMQPLNVEFGREAGALCAALSRVSGSH
jgi:hypothetical protein